jgi:hypothetical protein
MGGSGGGGGGSRRSSATSGSSPSRSSGKGGGGAGGGSGMLCPPKISAAITGPVAGITAGTWLEVVLRPGTPSRVVVTDLVRGIDVGSISGIPGLNVLINCLENGVHYRAYVDRVHGGRVDVTLVRQ